MEPWKLDVHLSTYIKGIQKLHGGKYEPDSITTVFGRIDRHLRENNYVESVMESAYFKNSREMIKAKRKVLKAVGKGNKPL